MTPELEKRIEKKEPIPHADYVRLCEENKILFGCYNGHRVFVASDGDIFERMAAEFGQTLRFAHMFEAATGENFYWALDRVQDYNAVPQLEGPAPVRGYGANIKKILKFAKRCLVKGRPLLVTREQYDELIYHYAYRKRSNSIYGHRLEVE